MERLTTMARHLRLYPSITVLPIAPISELTTPARPAHFNRREKANIRANKPVPGRRTQSLAVAHELLDGGLDGTKCDGAGRCDKTDDSFELSGSQEVRGFESLRLH
jgi:hypothetical protein